MARSSTTERGTAAVARSIAAGQQRTRLPSPLSVPRLGGAVWCQPGTPIPVGDYLRNATMATHGENGRDRARSGVDAARCRKDLRGAAGMPPVRAVPW